MPVHSELRQNKHRVIEPSGKIAKNSAGTALDGGGYDSEADCRTQVVAINGKQHTILSRVQGQAFAMSSSDFIDDNNVHRKSFKKDVISTGTYIHPYLDWTLDVTVDRMNMWVGTFKLMRTNGVDIAITQDHSRFAEDTLGYITDLFVEGNTLFAIHEFRGDDAIELAGKVKNVSVLVEPDYVDGKGRHYGEAVLHSSLEQDPIVPDQGEFIAMAASRTAIASNVPRFTLSQHSGTKEIDMKITAEMLTSIRELLGLDELTEDKAIEVMLSRLTEQSTAIGEHDGKVKELTDKVTELEATIAASRSGEAPKIDPDITDQQAENAEDRVKMLVDSNKILPAVGQTLSRILIGEKGSRNAYCLSRRMSGTPESVARDVLSALGENDIVKLGEQTHKRDLELSRQTPGEPDAAVDDDTQKEMIGVGTAHTGGTVQKS